MNPKRDAAFSFLGFILFLALWRLLPRGWSTAAFLMMLLYCLGLLASLVGIAAQKAGKL